MNKREITSNQGKNTNETQVKQGKRSKYSIF